MFKIFTLIIFASLFVSCSKTNSEDVKTSGIYATFKIEGDAVGNAKCRAEFRVGGPIGTYLELTGGDKITCNGATLNKSEFLGMVQYKASVPHNTNGEYKFEYTRPEEDPYISTAWLPPAAKVKIPEEGIRLTKGELVTVDWIPIHSDNMNIRVCHFETTQTTTQTSDSYKTETSHKEACVSHNQNPEVGNAILDPSFNDMEREEGGTITLKRTRPGHHSSSLDGYTEGIKTMVVPVTFVPKEVGPSEQ